MNPFISNFKLKVIKMHQTYKETRTSDVDEGAILKWKTVTENYLVEQQEKTSVYGISYIENVLFGEDVTMRYTGRDLLLYIIYNIGRDEDTINLKQEKVCKQMRTGKTTLYSAIQQLMDASIICKKHTTEYWVNPFYIFKGDRLKYYNANCPSCIEQVAEVVKK